MARLEVGVTLVYTSLGLHSHRLDLGLQSVSPDRGSSLFSICSVAVKTFLAKFLWDYHLPPTSQKISWNFNLAVYYRSWTIWHVIIFQNYGSHYTINVKQEFYYMPNGLTYKIHNRINQNFQRCLKKVKK